MVEHYCILLRDETADDESESCANVGIRMTVAHGKVLRHVWLRCSSGSASSGEWRTEDRNKRMHPSIEFIYVLLRSVLLTAVSCLEKPSLLFFVRV